MEIRTDEEAHLGPAATSALRKNTMRIIPILVLGYFISYLDRINISYAKFGMQDSFGMSATTYGLAAGIFFLGYIIFEVPSSIMMRKYGARVWLTRIMVTWGIIASAMAFAPNSNWIIALRFLLGVAEAGFFPGVIVYLANWFPNAYRTKAIATLMISIPIASVFGGPVNGLILDNLDGVLGFDGWRWLFFLGGVPAVLIGILFFSTVVDTPQQAKWLNEEERAWLTKTLADEERTREISAPSGHAAMFRDKRVLTLGLVYFLLLCGAYPLTYWLPSVVSEIGGDMSGLQLGAISAIPFAFAAAVMYLVGRTVRAQGSAKPVAIALGVSVIAFAVTASTLTMPLLALGAITIATAAAQSAKPLFWSLPTAYLSGAAAASGIALINSLGNAAGFFSPYAFGWIQDASAGNDALSMSVMIAANIFALILVVLVYCSRKQKWIHRLRKN